MTMTKMDPLEWIAHRCGSLEGPTIAEYLAEFGDARGERAAALRNFRDYEEEGLIFRTALFANGFRMYSDEAPVPLVVTDETRLFHDIFDTICWAGGGGSKDRNGPRLSRLRTSVQGRHIGVTDRQIMLEVYRLMKAGALKPVDNPIKNVFEFEFPSDDPEDMDEFLIDKSNYAALPAFEEDEFKQWIGLKNYDRFAPPAEPGIIEDDPEDPVLTKTPQEIFWESAKENAPEQLPSLNELAKPEPPEKPKEPQEEPAPVLTPPTPVQAAPVQETSPSPQAGLSLLDTLVQGQTTINAAPRNIRRLAALGDAIQEFAEGLSAMGKGMSKVARLMDNWQDEDVIKVLEE